MDAEFRTDRLDELAASINALPQADAKKLAERLSSTRIETHHAFWTWLRRMQNIEAAARLRAGLPATKARQGAPPIPYQVAWWKNRAYTAPVFCLGQRALAKEIGAVRASFVAQMLKAKANQFPDHLNLWTWGEHETYLVQRLPVGTTPQSA